MAGLIDSNILLYAANRAADEHAAASRFLAGAARSADRWYLTEGIVYEYLRVSTHHRVFDRPLTWREALAFLQPLLGSDAFAVLTAGDRHWGVLATELARLKHPGGNLFFDVRTVVIMREHGVRTIYTTDTDFLQFRDLEVVDPCSS
jgi:uncharacterized protein